MSICTQDLEQEQYMNWCRIKKVAGSYAVQCRIWYNTNSRAVHTTCGKVSSATLYHIVPHPITCIPSLPGL
jgi:hypothetical protein